MPHLLRSMQATWRTTLLPPRLPQLVCSHGAARNPGSNLAYCDACLREGSPTVGSSIVLHQGCEGPSPWLQPGYRAFLSEERAHRLVDTCNTSRPQNCFPIHTYIADEQGNWMEQSAFLALPPLPCVPSHPAVTHSIGRGGNTCGPFDPTHSIIPDRGGPRYVLRYVLRGTYMFNDHCLSEPNQKIY
jgi:hypothetical protein